MPFTNDEGAYLFDAKLLSQGILPAGNVLTKAPVPALLFSVSASFSNYSLYATRTVSVLLSLASAIPIFWISLRLSGKKAAVFSATLWLLALPASVHILGITEPSAAFFTALFLALCIESLHQQRTNKPSFKIALTAGIVFALAFASRKTALVALAPATVLLFTSNTKYKRIAIYAILGTATIITIWLIAIAYIYGYQGIRQATGIGYSEIIYQKTHGTSWQTNLRWVSETALRHFSGFAVLIVISTIFTVKNFLKNTAVISIPLIWITALAVLYSTSPSFMPEYLIDFFAPIVILASIALSSAHKYSHPLAYTLCASAIVAGIYGSLNTYAKPWTGMFTSSAIKEMSAELINTIPQNENIFTAAAILPYASGHNIPHNISHPLWYRYAFLPDNTKNTFLPPLSVIEEEIESGPVQWAVVEHLTDYAYLRHESNLITLFGKNWQLVKEIPNETGYRSNTLRLYRRSAP